MFIDSVLNVEIFDLILPERNFVVISHSSARGCAELMNFLCLSNKGSLIFEPDILLSYHYEFFLHILARAGGMVLNNIKITFGYEFDLNLSSLKIIPRVCLCRFERFYNLYISVLYDPGPGN